MIKFAAIIAMMCGFSVSYTIPTQNAFLNYQQPMAIRSTQRTMYGLHLLNQQFRNQRVAAFLEEHPNDVDGADYPVQSPNVESVAEAYPSEQFPVEDEPQPEVPAFDELETEDSVDDEPAASASDPAFESGSIPEKKIENLPDTADATEEEEQETQVVRRRTSSKSTGANAYFPINFGNVQGGAIAVANSYSTGNSGSSISTAKAYGSLVNAELRRSSLVQLRKKSAKLRGRQY
ncbi:uncharacterized protein LOC134215282 [Armigeres subalbatus]|uniref:uncharacterized protein LOC134215282 n=1 Tax=Armigeres subalbatus TaxID=124917 RepID=UPI002ED57A7D